MYKRNLFNFIIIVVAVLLLFINSCASITNQANTKTTIITTKTSKIICNDDTIETQNNKALLSILRSNKPVNILIINDSFTSKLLLKPINSPAYYANVLYNLGFGIWFERNNPKRYTYPSLVYINSHDSLSKITRFPNYYKKGEIHLHLSLPYLNTLYLTPDNLKINANTGFLGFCIGLDYYHSKKQFLNLSGSAVLDFFVPFPAPVHFEGVQEFRSSQYLSLTNNHKVNQFSLGYGLAFAQNNWRRTDFGSFDSAYISQPTLSKSNNALGLTFSTYIQTGQHFNLGIIYRPTFYRFNSPNSWQYEHLISIDFAWKFKLKKANNR